MKEWIPSTMDPDPVRLLLASLLEERGLNHAAVSRAIGRNHAYIHQFMHQRKPPKLPEAAREALGKFLGVDPDRLRDPKEPPREATTLDPRLVRRTRAAVDKLLSDLPVDDEVASEVFSAVYALLERGRRIDDDFTLSVVARLLQRILRPEEAT